MDASSPTVERLSYELRFGSLFDAGRAFAFPCDASGLVDLSSLSEKARQSYRLVCALVGREVSLPRVQLNPATHKR
jgi:hypothetical protein